MKSILHFITRIYDGLLNLYPGRFRAEFGEEMQTVFSEAAKEAAAAGKKRLAIIFVRELLDFPLGLIREHWLELVHRKDTAMSTGIEHMENPKTQEVPFKKERSSRWEALVGVLPFLAFGLINMLGEISPSVPSVYSYLVFYLLLLTGLVISGLKDFPQWSFSYIGWSLLFVWVLNMVRIVGLTVFGMTLTITEAIIWRIGVLLLLVIAIGIPLLWRRSLRPLEKLVHGIWHDWPRLSLGMYAFLAWLSLIYDENHHPYLLAFILASTLITSAGAWIFLRSDTTKRQALALVAGIAIAQILNSISYATWDWQAYYGLTPSEPDAWYVSASRTLFISAFMGIWLFWPFALGLLNRAANRQKMS